LTAINGRTHIGIAVKVPSLIEPVWRIVDRASTIGDTSFVLALAQIVIIARPVAATVHHFPHIGVASNVIFFAIPGIGVRELSEPQAHCQREHQLFHFVSPSWVDCSNESNNFDRIDSVSIVASGLLQPRCLFIGRESFRSTSPQC
jgi:hypothetical protein